MPKTRRRGVIAVMFRNAANRSLYSTIYGTLLRNELKLKRRCVILDMKYIIVKALFSFGGKKCNPKTMPVHPANGLNHP